MRNSPPHHDRSAALRNGASLALLLLLTLGTANAADPGEHRPRARELGLVVGVLPPGPANAITDVGEVRVGHSTIVRGDDVRTGVTAIIPAPGNLFTHPLPAALYVINGYGKLLGGTQLEELGELETPVLLTCTLCVWAAADALKRWIYEQPDMPRATVNPVVGETNDGRVNDLWAEAVGDREVRAALERAAPGPVAEGSVGAGAGTQAFGWKGGIGTSSRRLPAALGGHTVGVLVQTNFGGTLTMNGAPVGRELGRYAFADALTGSADDDGSIMIVLATDAPIHARQLKRLARRATLGLGRTGSYASNGSGDYVIAFSTHPALRLPRDHEAALAAPRLSNGAMSPLFAAAVEATEEAIYNALLKATTVTSRLGHLEELPIDGVREILERYGALGQQETLAPGQKSVD